MFPHDYFATIGMGGLFILLGLIAILWGRREEKEYDDYLSRLEDARGFLFHWAERIEPKALKAGGWISIAVGLVLLILGLAFLFGG